MKQAATQPSTFIVHSHARIRRCINYVADKAALNKVRK